MDTLDEIRKYINLLEDSAGHARFTQHVPLPSGTVIMPTMSSSSPYDIYRMGVNVANEDEELVPTIQKDDAIFIFYNQEMFDRALRLFARHGYPSHLLKLFKSEEEADVFTTSPVASNQPWKNNPMVSRPKKERQKKKWNDSESTF